MLILKKKILYMLSFLMIFSMSGCQKKETHEWNDQYQITYFYVEDCANCQHFKEDVLPAIEEEFGDHMEIVAYDMDTDENFDEMKEVYDQHISQIIDFDEENYGFGPMVFLEGYIAILGAGNADDYVNHLVSAILDGKMDEADEDNETYYYLKDGKVKE